MTVAGLRPRHREIGRLRLGTAEPIKGKKGSKITRLDTWRLTSSHLDILNTAAKLWGGKVAEWKGQGSYELITETDSLQVLIPEQDMEAGQYLEEWSGGGIIRRCDGTTELIGDQPCLRDADKPCDCKISSHLLVVLPELPDMGVFRLTTRGWNAAAELPEAVRMVRMLAQTGFQLPHAELGIEHRTKKVGGETHSFVVPVLRLPYTLAEAGLGAAPVRPALPEGVDPETGEIVSAPRVVASGISEATAAPAVVPGGDVAKAGRVGADTNVQPRTGTHTVREKGAGKSSSVEAGNMGPSAGEDSTSGEAEGGKPQQSPSSQSTSPEDVREGEELRERGAGSPARTAAQTADVEYPSRRPCLHLLGTNSVYRDHNGTQVRVEVCTQCGMVIEEIAKL
jgi:hypothetical protein